MAWDIKKRESFVQSGGPRSICGCIRHGSRTHGTGVQDRQKQLQKGRPQEWILLKKLRALLAEQLDVDPAKITMDSDIMSDFEADSLDIVDMVMTLEDEFGIEVPDDAIESLRTVGDVVNFVDSHAQN